EKAAAGASNVRREAMCVSGRRAPASRFHATKTAAAASSISRPSTTRRRKPGRRAGGIEYSIGELSYPRRDGRSRCGAASHFPSFSRSSGRVRWRQAVRAPQAVLAVVLLGPHEEDIEPWDRQATAIE